MLLRLSAILACAAIVTVSATEETNIPTLPEITVSAPPIIQGNVVNNHGSQYSVIGTRQISDLNATDLADTLRVTPGVNISRFDKVGSYGGAGGGAIFIRGMGASRPGGELLTMVDGVPRYNAVFSHPLLDLISIDAADTINVYKSPQPQLFGNAFAAVEVNTKRVSEDGHTAQLEGSYGTDNTGVEKVSGGGKMGAFDYYAGQSYRGSDGHRDNSGGETQDYFLRLGYALGDEWNVSYFGDHTNNYAEDPGAEDSAWHMGNYKTHDWFNVVTIANQYESAEGFVKPYWHRGHAAWLDQGMRESGRTVLPNETDSTLMDWDLYGVRAREQFKPWEGGELSVGMDYDVMSGKAGFETYDPAFGTHFNREDFVIYSPYLAASHLFGSKDNWYAQPSAGLRFYEHNIFGAELSPHGGMVFGYKDTQLHANYARGVNYPGLNVAAFSHAVLPPIYNNPAKRDAWRELDAETLDHYEFGISHQFSEQLQAGVTTFLDQGNNRYVMVFPTSGAPVPIGFQNIGNYHNYGIEGSVTWSPVKDFTLFTGMTWLRSSVTGMPYAPEFTASGGFNWRFLNRFRLCMDLLYQDRMYVNPTNAYARSNAPANNPRVPSFITVNAKLSYLFKIDKIHLKESELFLALSNLTDTRYYYRPGYPMPGIGGMLGASLNF